MKRHFCVLLTIIPFILQGQDIVNYQKKNYTIENGLPSNECYVALQDSLGYLWIATDRGLSRFDGYGFKNYGINEGLLELSCLQMQTDRHGDIWLRTYSNRFYKYLHKEDTIVAYEFNDKVLDFIEKWEILDFYSTSDTLYISIVNKGIVKIDKSGDIIPYKPKLKTHYYSFLNIEGKILCYVYDPIIKNEKGLKNYGNGNIFPTGKIHIKGISYYLKYRKNQEKFASFIGFEINKSRLLYYNSGYIYLFNNLSLDTIISSLAMKDLEVLPNGKLITGNRDQGGLNEYNHVNDLGTDRYHTIIPNISVSHILTDKDSSLIITTLEHGIFILKLNNIVQVKNSILDDQEIINIQSYKTSEIYLNINQNTVVQLNLESNKIKHLDSVLNERLFHLYIDFKNNLSFHSSFPISYLIGKNEKIYLYEYKINGLPLIAKKVRRLQDGKYLVLTSTGIKTFENLLDKPTFESYPTINRLEPLDVIDYKNGYLIGGRDGLYFLRGYDKVKLNSFHPFFNYRINTIERIKDTYYLGSLGGGLGIWDGEKGIKILTIKDGLISNNIEKIITNSLNTVIVCTKAGMSVIKLGDSITIHNFTKKHGLPSNQVNDVLFINDTLFIATSKGLAYLKSNSKYIQPKRPILESFEVNNEPISLKEYIDLSHLQNTISISYKALDYTQDGNIEYSYSLNNESWQQTRETEVNLASLQPGKYIFAVRSSNKDGVWSEPRVIEFRIEKPWWQNAWFWTLVASLGIVLIYYYYSNRIKDINAKNETQKEITKLERAALKAQMNPHFIFNCLNSIQSYIIQNDKDQAMEYLSKFAKLIRQYLNASANETISLAQEIDMLRNYLFLERIRFNNVFDYRFEVSKNLSTEDIQIPALLLQPIIENAVLHGMKDKTQDGIIEVLFRQVNTQLEVTIRDNGQGLQSQPQNVSRKSYGMSITQKRLEMINKHKDNYTIKSRTDDSGTEVIMKINFN